MKILKVSASLKQKENDRRNIEQIPVLLSFNKTKSAATLSKSFNHKASFYTIFIINQVINQAENFSRLFPLLFARKFNYLYFFLNNLVKSIVKCHI